MSRFCLECGAKAQPSDLVCTECGTKFVEAVQVQPEKSVENSKTPMTKKNKAIAVIAVLFISVLVGLYMFGNSYASAENTLKRFHKAVVDKDNSTLKKIVEFEGGAELSEGELDAIIAFGETEPNKFTKSIVSWGHVSESFLFAIKQSGKVFGIFDGYKLIVPNQYVSVPFQYEELEYTLNGEKLKMEKKDGRALIGPIAPGVYELNANYKGEYAEFAQTEQIELLEEYGDVVFADLEFDISNVTFQLDFPYGTDPSKTKLFIGDKEVAFDKDGTLESVGPFPLDGSIKVKTVSEFPWGTTESEELEIDETYIDMKITGIDEETKKNISDVVLAYGEQYVGARAIANAKDMNSATAGWKKVMQEDFDYEQETYGGFSGQLDEVQANFEDAHLTSENKNFLLVFPVSFSIRGVLGRNGKSPDLENDIQTCKIEVIYIKDEWKIDSCHADWYNQDVGGTVIEGSKKFHKAIVKAETNKVDKVSSSGDSAAKEDSNVNHAELESVMQRYNDASVAAINENDFSRVSNMIVSGAPREKEQSDFVGYLNSISITEDHLSTSLESFKSTDDTTIEVTTIESFNLHYPDKASAKKSYRTVTQLQLVGGEWLIYKLISTTEIK